MQQWFVHQIWRRTLRTWKFIQQAATKMAPRLRDLPYKERLIRLDLMSLEQRRIRGNLITAFQLMAGLEKINREDLIAREE